MSTPVPAPATPATRRRPQPRLLQVLRIQDVTPLMRRITLGGDEIVGFPSGREGSHIKIFVPRPGQSKPMMPTLGPDGPVWPPADQRPFARTYTIRHYNEAAGELDIDFVLHGDDGPASAWAEHVQIGDFLGIAGPGGRGPIALNADWYLFATDATGLPAVSAHLERLPENAQGFAFIEIENAAEEQPLVHPTGITLQWLHRNGTAAHESTLLIDAVRQIAWPEKEKELFVWIAGEARSVIALRHYARVERGLERSQVDAVPYWKAGEAEETYHDERHRVMDEDDG